MAVCSVFPQLISSIFSEATVFQAGGQDCVCGGGQFGESGIWPGYPGGGLDTHLYSLVTELLKVEDVRTHVCAFFFRICAIFYF